MSYHDVAKLVPVNKSKIMRCSRLLLNIDQVWFNLTKGGAFSEE